MSDSSDRAADAEESITRFQRQREDAMPDCGGDYNEPKQTEPKNAGSPRNEEVDDESNNRHRRKWLWIKCLTFGVLFLLFAIVLGE